MLTSESDAAVEHHHDFVDAVGVRLDVIAGIELHCHELRCLLVALVVHEHAVLGAVARHRLEGGTHLEVCLCPFVHRDEMAVIGTLILDAIHVEDRTLSTMTVESPTHNIADPLVALASPIGNLTELPGNPRRGDVDAIARSLRVFTQRKPVTARRTGTDEHGNPVGYVTAGNHTLQAARDRLAWTHIAVVWVDEDETTANAWALADNHLSEMGSNDVGALVAMLEAIDDPDLLEATAYDEATLAALLDNGLPPPEDVDPAAIRQTFGVVIECADESEQVALLKRFTDEGLRVRAVM